jgi:hypothetical protein
MLLLAVGLGFIALQAPAVDDLPLRPIPGPEAPPPEPAWAAWFALSLTAGVAFLAMFVLAGCLRRARRRPPRRSAEEWALAELSRLEKLEQAPEPRLTRLADIVRRYLALRHQIHAPERTTDEFRGALAECAALAASARTLVVELLSQADLVKFARGQVAPDDVAKWITQVRQLLAMQAKPATKGSD